MRKSAINQSGQYSNFDSDRVGRIDHDINKSCYSVVQIELGVVIIIEGIVFLAISLVVRVIERV